jgi:hypothetical protein
MRVRKVKLGQIEDTYNSARFFSVAGNDNGKGGKSVPFLIQTKRVLIKVL